MSAALPPGPAGGRYEIVRELGRGGSATVFLARDVADGRELALKVLHAELSQAISAERFRREIRLLAVLQHPRLLGVVDWGSWEDRLFLVMPYIAGETLEARLAREHQLPIDEAIAIARQLCEGLAYAHARRIVHRDVKPSNVLLAGGQAWLSDFGVAKGLDVSADERVTTSGVIVGTMAYMSPEQAAGERVIDGRSDIYSLGCVLYEMLAGVHPFVASDQQRALAMRMLVDPAPLRVHRPRVPAHVERVVERALARVPTDRWQSAERMARELGELPDAPVDSGARAAAGVPPPSPARQPLLGRGAALFRRHRIAGTMGAVGLVGLIAAAAVLSNRQEAVGTPLASGVVAIAPIQLRDSDLAASPLPHRLQEGLARAVARWQGLTPRVHGEDGTPGQMEPREIARRLGTGLVLVPQLARRGDSLDVVLQLWDAGDEHPRGRAAAATGSAALAPALVDSLVDLVLRPEGAPAGVRALERRGGSFVAFQSYARGRRELEHGRVAGALPALQLAEREDPRMPSAAIWMAAAQYLTSPEGAEWPATVSRARARDLLVSPTDSALGAALDAIARGAFAEGRAALRTIAAPDAQSAVILLLRGDVERRDPAVVRSPGSPTGWAFRGSHERALRLYEQVLARGDSGLVALAAVRLRRLLHIEPFRLRAGADSTGRRFAAFVSLDRDTLANWPVAEDVMATGSARSLAGDRAGALRANQERLLAVAHRWRRLVPREPRAWELLADVREARGEVSAAGASGISATAALAEARRLSSGAPDRTRLATRAVRLAIKGHRWREARDIGDSLLAVDDPTLAPIAVLLGRLDLAGHLLSRGRAASSAAGSESPFPERIEQRANVLFVRAAAGACGDELRLIDELRHDVETFLPPDRQAATLALLTDRPRSLMVPCTDGRTVSRLTRAADALTDAQRRYAAGDREGSRRALRALALARRHDAPTAISLDDVYQESWLTLAMGDSLAAKRRMADALESLASRSSALLDDIAQAAALPRMMRSYLELCRALHDTVEASRWSGALSDLQAPARDRRRPPAAARSQPTRDSARAPSSQSPGARLE